MKKEDIENGIKIYLESLKNSKMKIKFKKDVSYLRKMDGKFLDSSNKVCHVLGNIILTEDPEKVRLLDPVIQKMADKRSIKFEDLGEVDI
ncbi:MAG: hypothetical protein EAX96_04580 [Candidatus Lokiarchaeota archaeon]|nr:hypothetical protein [Candidatus Lokiarchaeota archaeon]